MTKLSLTFNFDSNDCEDEQPMCQNLTGAGNPSGSVNPQFVGQVYVETGVTPNAVWQSVGLTSSDWTRLGEVTLATGNLGKSLLGDGSLTSYTIQDVGLKSGLKIFANTALTTIDAPVLAVVENNLNPPTESLTVSQNNQLLTASFPSLTTITVPVFSASGALNIASNPLLTSVSLPLLATMPSFSFSSNASLLAVDLPSLTGLVGPVGGTALGISSNTVLTSISAPLWVGNASVNYRLTITLNPALTSIDLPLLDTLDRLIITSNVTLTDIDLPAMANVNSTCQFTGNTALTSISLPALVTAGAGIAAASLANLTSVTLTNYLPTNTRTQDFSGCALDEASVDHVLARCVANAAYVSGSVLLNGGTNSAPSAAGLADAATLTGRGCTVSVNP